ncbi:hypothetical protein LVD15_10205 [Fulvivirga maritima]|uniref:hypothetical protein n=1 Tax=Fulvivirga maritima TaxID=2904247 RepID=UPI001F33D58B|nr:hypothetical protein [Fulvivirga maritima]UII28773.1 hypothetical protein LVD15_10205 [Fulvivirga maritima]
MNCKYKIKELILLCFLALQGCSNGQPDQNVLNDHKYSVMILHGIERSVIEKEMSLASEKGAKELVSTLSDINEFNDKLIEQAGGIKSEGYFPAISYPNNRGSVAKNLMQTYNFQLLLENYLSLQLLNGRIDKEQHKTLISVLHNYLDKNNGILKPSTIEKGKISDVIVHILLLEMWLTDL